MNSSTLAQLLSSIMDDLSKPIKTQFFSGEFHPKKPSFHHFLSSGLHLLFILLLVPTWFSRKRLKKPPMNKSSSNVTFRLTMVCSVALCGLFGCLAVFNYLEYWDDSSNSVEVLSTQLDFLIQSLSWFLISLFLRFGVYEKKYPMLIRLWWLLFFVVSVYAIVVDTAVFGFDVVREYVWVDLLCVLVGVFLCYACLWSGTGINDVGEETNLSEPLLNGHGPHGDEKSGVIDNVTPYAKAGLFSILTFSWMSPLIAKGNEKPLDLDDVPDLADCDSVKIMYADFRKRLEEKDGVSSERIGTLKLAKALFMTVWKEVSLTAFLCLLYTCSSYVGPFLIDSLVQYLNGRERFVNEGYVLVFTFFAAKFIECLSQRHWFFRAQQVGMRNRAVLSGIIYQKGLSLSCQARQSRTSGEVINLMSVDAERIGDFSWYLNDLWMVPIQVTLALVVLYNSLGIACIAALAATFLVMLGNIPLGKWQEKYQDKLMEAKDNRMKTTSEILRNMRILKLQTWEMKFLSKISDLRAVETSWLKKYLYTSASTTFLFWGAPIFISVVSFGTCMLLGIPLTSGRVLSALATFRVLQEPIYNLPDTISMVAQTKVSLDRVAGFLCLEDIQVDAVLRTPKEESTTAIEVLKGVFSWHQSSNNVTLRDLDFKIGHGMKVAVCGTVGSGKSSLLSCILGEVPKLSGSIKLSGTTAYIPQSAWIQSGKIEDNILFGREMDRERYEQVLEVCALKKDLEILPFGDQTVIGERGINLSGGQKQRIQIARAIYQDADIYLFDDPFSAVDAHTGTHLFKQCLLNYLQSKTVVYVTHQVEFLPAADIIMVMKDGTITQAGSYDAILTSGTDFLKLVGAHKEALSAIDAVQNRPAPGSQVDDDDKSDKHNHTYSMQVIPDAEPTKQNGIDNKKAGSDEVEETKGQLVQEEEREKGTVGFSVYWEYMTASYGGALVPVILLAHILFQLLQISSNYWMAWATPVSGNKAPVSSLVMILVYVALAFGSSICILTRAMLLATAGYKTATILFNKMHKAIFRAPMSFFDSTPTGRILNRASTDQSAVDENMHTQIGSSAFSIITLLGIIAVMSQASWQVFVIFIPVGAASIWLQQYYISTARELSRLVGVCKAPIIQHFSESLSGAATIRSFDQGERFMKMNLHLVDGLSRPKFHIAGAMEWLCFRLDMLSNLTFASSLVFLVFMPRGIIDPGIAGLSVTYGLTLNTLQAWVVWNLCNLENKIISVERILQYTRIQSEPPLMIETNRPSNNWPQRGEIEISNLQVRYAPHLPLVLKGLTLNINGGTKTGIVGRTGSGKSTLVQTLFRIVDPTFGRISIDGIDISTIGLHDLRSKLSIIPQDPTMFEGTIRSNLDPLEEYNDNQIWEALEKCQLGDIVRQKEGKLDSLVTENGENWSVGQRQLVCLGRVLLKNSRVLVLDEATASVDTATDNLIQQTLRHQFSECTVITIAHRIASVLDSDMVLLLDNGNVAEYDSPRKLLENGDSAFARLVAEYTMRSNTSIEREL